MFDWIVYLHYWYYWELYQSRTIEGFLFVCPPVPWPSFLSPYDLFHSYSLINIALTILRFLFFSFLFLLFWIFVRFLIWNSLFFFYFCIFFYFFILLQLLRIFLTLSRFAFGLNIAGNYIFWDVQFWITKNLKFLLFRIVSLTPFQRRQRRQNQFGVEWWNYILELYYIWNLE